MRRAWVGILVGVLLGRAAPLAADELVPSVARLAQRVAEHGPIRRQLDEAQATPVGRTAAEALGVVVIGAPSVRPPHPPARSFLSLRAVLLLLTLAAVALYLTWGRGWDEI
jgi:hypothetical protein